MLISKAGVVADGQPEAVLRNDRTGRAYGVKIEVETNAKGNPLVHAELGGWRPKVDRIENRLLGDNEWIAGPAPFKVKKRFVRCSRTLEWRTYMTAQYFTGRDETITPYLSKFPAR